MDGIRTIDSFAADNPLIVGHAVHEGIEKGLEAGIQDYTSNFPILMDEHYSEILKMEFLIPLVRKALPSGGEFEVPVMDKDFIGFIDYLLPVEAEPEMNQRFQYYDLYDFKYTVKSSRYKDSCQLQLYKYFFEKMHPGKKIRKSCFLIIPKINLKQMKSESIADYRNRLKDALKETSLKTIYQEMEVSKVAGWYSNIKAILEETEFPKKDSFMCSYCEYCDYCMKGWDYMLKLPENKRRNLEKVSKRTMWIYGVPFSGKTTFANAFPDPLMLNTDGNIKFVDSPYIRIKDEVTVEGRITKRKMAWEVFKEVIAELEKKENTFKTIVIDLLEDMYEHCRVYMYQQMGISHESDDSFRAWDKVRGEFLNTLKRLMNLDYENIILISHEDTTKDITRKGGDKVTAIKPNLQDKVAVKVAGMVDVVARIVADADIRTFCFKSNEVIFGGGRLKVNAKDIPLDVDELFKVYDEANANVNKALAKSADIRNKAAEKEAATNISGEEEKAPENENMKLEKDIEEDPDPFVEPETEKASTEEKPAPEPEKAEPEKPVKRTRKRRNA